MGALTASDTVVDKGLPSLCRSSIYYLPGHGGRLGTGLGEGLLSRGFDVAGRETVGEFKDQCCPRKTYFIAGRAYAQGCAAFITASTITVTSAAARPFSTTPISIECSKEAEFMLEEPK